MATSENGKTADRAEYGKNPDFAFIFPNNGGAMILGEKIILAAKSDVMKKQFTFSQNSDEKLERITITDIPFDTFNEMMKHIYGKSIQVHEDNYANLLYASRKYFVDDLTGNVIEFLKRFLNKDNLHHHIDFIEKFQIKVLDDIMRDISINYPLKVIGNLTDSASHKRILKNILESPLLSCTEFELYEAVVKMMEKHQTSESRCPRKALGNLFYLIRFPTMSLTELLNCGKKPSLLTPEELLDFIQSAQNKMFSNTLQFYSLVPRLKASYTNRGITTWSAPLMFA